MARPIKPAELIAVIRRRLDEAEGFLPEQPRCSASLIHDAICEISRLTLYLRPSQEFLIDRLRFNLQVARAHAEIAPDVAAAYAKGCRFELGQLAEELAKHPEGVCR